MRGHKQIHVHPGQKETSYGNIWIATDHGLDFLLHDTDTVIRIRDTEDKYNLGDLKITSLLKSSYEKNIMWVGTESFESPSSIDIFSNPTLSNISADAFIVINILIKIP